MKALSFDKYIDSSTSPYLNGDPSKEPNWSAHDLTFAKSKNKSALDLMLRLQEGLYFDYYKTKLSSDYLIFEPYRFDIEL